MEKDYKRDVNALKGGIGCDIVTATGTFNARKGAIYGLQSNADSSRLTGITEVRTNLGVATDKVSLTGGSGRSYLNAKDINNGKWVIFDYPVSAIIVGAGSFYVYYQEI
jgi:hypothetical protein